MVGEERRGRRLTWAEWPLHGVEGSTPGLAVAFSDSACCFSPEAVIEWGMPFSYLTAVELFQGISESESQRVARMCTERRYRKGTTIFSKGDPANSLYIVKDGR